MVYIVLFFLILLVAAGLVLLIQNFAIWFSSVHLTFFIWHLPGIPVFLLFLLGVFLGGLLIFIFSMRSAWRDGREIKRLNARVKELCAQIEELEKSQMRSPSGALSPNFAPPAVPIQHVPPSGTPGSSGPLGQKQAVRSPQPGQPKWRQNSSWLLK